MRDWPGSSRLEALFRRPGSASSLKGSKGDRGTTRSIVIAFALASDLPLLARWLPLRPLPRAAAPTGLALQATGLALRAWSMHALGSSYTRTLRVACAGQELVDRGPYRWVRHPGYLGSLMTWTGFRSPPAACLPLCSSLPCSASRTADGSPSKRSCSAVICPATPHTARGPRGWSPSLCSSSRAISGEWYFVLKKAAFLRGVEGTEATTTGIHEDRPFSCLRFKANSACARTETTHILFRPRSAFCLSLSRKYQSC